MWGFSCCGCVLSVYLGDVYQKKKMICALFWSRNLCFSDLHMWHSHKMKGITKQKQTNAWIYVMQVKLASLDSTLSVIHILSLSNSLFVLDVTSR